MIDSDTETVSSCESDIDSEIDDDDDKDGIIALHKLARSRNVRIKLFVAVYSVLSGFMPGLVSQIFVYYVRCKAVWVT